jgi:hypothetical protein
MSAGEQFARKLSDLHRLVRFQRLVRAGLRSAWLFGAGCLLAWAGTTLSGWNPGMVLWFAAGGVFSLVGWVPLLFQRTSNADFAWRVDRTLGLKEQFSTAWSTGRAESANPVVELLHQDALAQVPPVQRRILRKGWRILGELISCAIVVLLGMAVYLGYTPFDAGKSLQEGERKTPPALSAVDVPREQALPKGVLSLKPTETPGQTPAPASPGGQAGQPGKAGELDAAVQALQQAGAQLSQQAATFELGDALSNQDLQKAADQLERLADQLDSLSQSSKDQIGQEMSKAAGALGKLSQGQKLADDLNQAAQAMKPATDAANKPAKSARDALDVVAGDLRSLNMQAQAANPQASSASSSSSGGSSGSPGQGAGLGGGAPVFGAAEALDRLEEASGDFKLDLHDPAMAGILTPGQTTTRGDQVASGAASITGTASATAGQSALFPFSYPWKRRDVISEYFQRGY